MGTDRDVMSTAELPVRPLSDTSAPNGGSIICQLCLCQNAWHLCLLQWLHQRLLTAVLAQGGRHRLLEPLGAWLSLLSLLFAVAQGES